MTEFVVCCTGRRTSHGRIDFSPLVREGDTIHERLLRSTPAPWGKGASLTADGETLPMPPRGTAMAASARVDRDGEERWRWKCPKCKLDRPLTGERLRKWMDLTLASGGVLLDISLLPR